MNNIIKIIKEDWKETSFYNKFLYIMAGCSVIMDIMTPTAIAYFWIWYFNLNTIPSSLILVVGGLATLFRAIKIGWMK